MLSLPGFSLVGQARSETEVQQLCQYTLPDVFVLDLRNSADHGRATVQNIHQVYPSTRFIFLQSSSEENLPSEECDANGIICVSRDVSEEEFRAVFLQIQQGGPRSGEDGSDNYAGFRPLLSEELETEMPESKQWAAPAIHPRNEDIMARELVMAGKIQADILPEEPPTLPGWDIAIKLEPARETSGDFYDFIPLTSHKWGVAVADVTDKGMGAALFMALSSTLMRTYATRFPTLPALALNAVSARILSDTRGSTFVTAFYGVLEPLTGRLIYANAGHPPGYLIGKRHGEEFVERLRPTGMALGVSDAAQWKQKIVRFSPGDMLLLYTDGITEAQNREGVFFDEDRLLDVAIGKINSSACEVRDALLDELHRFVGNASRQDDIALVVIRRLPE